MADIDTENQKLLMDEKKTKTNSKGIKHNPGTKVTSNDDKPPIESTTLWDYPKQSYGKTPKGNNKYHVDTIIFQW